MQKTKRLFNQSVTYPRSAKQNTTSCLRQPACSQVLHTSSLHPPIHIISTKTLQQLKFILYIKIRCKMRKVYKQSNSVILFTVNDRRQTSRLFTAQNSLFKCLSLGSRLSIFDNCLWNRLREEAHTRSVFYSAITSENFNKPSIGKIINLKIKIL